MDRSNNYSTDYISQGYYQRLVDTRMKCNQLSTKLETETDQELNLQFKQYLSFLAKELVPKYQRREDKELPKILEDKEHLQLTQLNVNECRKILRDFNDLMEKLGIVSKANQEYKMNTKGVKNKNE